MYEHRSDAVLPRAQFLNRVTGHLVLSIAIIVVSLSIGTFGYHQFARLHWIDAFLNASMILTGMGPVDALTDPGAKLFAACYALYSGVVFLAAVGVLAAPFFHRILHKLHVEEPGSAD
ncbi:MAG: hypothetical protein U1F08_04775 [Steroidobacteraceae bacterium]